MKENKLPSVYSKALERAMKDLPVLIIKRNLLDDKIKAIERAMKCLEIAVERES